jgi:4-hydroxyphenylacetate 3-monooxygenase
MPTEWGGFTHRYFKAPTNLQEQVAGRDAIAEWARITYGWLGRSPWSLRRAFRSKPFTSR